MNDTIATLFTTFLTILIFAIIARSLLSWFPNAQRNQFAQMLYRVTDPLIEPVRRIMPAMGGFDLSPMVVIFVLYVMIMVIQRASEA